MLAVYDDRELMEAFFSARQKELEALSKDTEYKLTLLDAARKRLRKEEDMRYTVTIKTIPERYAATVRMTIPRYEDEGIIWGKMAEETCRMGLAEDDPCLCAVTYLDGEYKEENVEMMAWKTVNGCQLHLQGQLRPDHGSLRCGHRVDGSKRLRTRRAHVQHLSHQSARDPKPG